MSKKKKGSSRRDFLKSAAFIPTHLYLGDEPDYSQEESLLPIRCPRSS